VLANTLARVIAPFSGRSLNGSRRFEPFCARERVRRERNVRECARSANLGSMSKSSISVAADVAGKLMVSASGSAADRLAMAGAAAVAFIGIAVGYRIYAEARAGLRSAKSSRIVSANDAT